MLRKATPIAATLALVALTASARAATIWTPLSSGTSGTISSIVYQSPARLWYATTGGTIAYWNGSSFTAASGPAPGENFVDLAFQPTSVAGGPGTPELDGYAVTKTGHVWRSTDGGVSWSQLSAPVTRESCASASPSVTESELNAVQWANETTVFLTGNDSTILRSANANAASPSFLEINKFGTGTCAVQNEPSPENMTDATFLPGNPADALFVDQNFGAIYQSSDALNTPVSGARVSSGTVNSFEGDPRLAQDAVNPNRIWVVDHEPGSAGCGTLCLVLSTDGGNTTSAATFPGDSHVIGGLYDISSQGGVEVTAGSGGEIFTSIDGTNFYGQPAEGTLATENWRAEAAYDAQHAVVGGENGGLAITAAANTLPAAPTPTPTPIATPVVNQPPPGPPSGSQPHTTHTGGATITVYRVVVVTGRSARFVPVLVSTSKPRKFTAEVLPAKGRKALATGRLTIKRKHGGHGTIRVSLPAKVKPGSYYIVVRETTLSGKKVGKPVKVKFTLK